MSQGEKQTSQQGRLPTGWGGVTSGTLAPPSPPFPLQLAPEHTLMSFRKALEQKLYGLQADVSIRLAWGRRAVVAPHSLASAFGSRGKTS